MLTEEESERDSIQTAESRELGEELPQDLATLPLAELRNLVHENSHANSTLKLETTMFEKFLSRMEPSDAHGHLVSERLDSSLDLGPAVITRGRRKSKSRITADRLVCLTIEQKCDLAQRELEETKEEIRRMKEHSEWVLQNYLAVLEEADIRVAEIRKAMSDFEKDVINSITKKKGSVIASDKVLRYMEERIRSRDILKEKIRLKNNSLEVQEKKMQLQLKQKEEMGEALHEVDFQQLKIENAQLLEKIEERNQDLLRQKRTVGTVLHNLNSYKRKLQTTTATASRLEKEIAQRMESIDKIEREFIVVEKEQNKADNLNKRLRRQLSEYKVPPVLDYVHAKISVHELEKDLKIWERKVEIAQMSLRSYSSIWQKAKMASDQLPALLPEKAPR